MREFSPLLYIYHLYKVFSLSVLVKVRTSAIITLSSLKCEDYIGE